MFGFNRAGPVEQECLFFTRRQFQRCWPGQEPCRDEAACADAQWHDAKQVGTHSGGEHTDPTRCRTYEEQSNVAHLSHIMSFAEVVCWPQRFSALL